MPATADADRGLSEPERVRRWRYAEARLAGLTRRESDMYSTSEIDCSDLRRLVASGATPSQIAKALLYASRYSRLLGYRREE